MKKRLLFLLSLFALSVTMVVGSANWVINSFNLDTDVYVDSREPSGVIENYYASQTEPYARFTNLKTAVDNANSKGQTVNMYIVPNSTLYVRESITINSGVTLFVPFVNQQWDNSEDEIGLLPNVFADSNVTNAKNNRVSLINFREGADLIINYGAKVVLGGEFRSVGITGRYSEFNLGEESSITVNGEFIAYGYVKENTLIHANLPEYQEDYDNANDAGRFINVGATGHLKTALGMQNSPSSGTMLLALRDNDILPVHTFEFPNLKTYVEVMYGGTFAVQARVFAALSSSFPIKANMEAYIVDSHTSTRSSMFYLQNGSIAFENAPAVLGLTSHVNSPTRFYINGDLKVGYLVLTLMGESINSADGFLPIGHKFQIYVKSGFTLSTDYRIKFLPGAILKVLPGAIVHINNEVIFYQKEHATHILPTYAFNSADSRFINNGTVIFGTAGGIGAFIETEMVNSSAVINFTNLPESGFSVTSDEGQTVVEISVVSSGLFFSDEDPEGFIGQFVVGSTLYSRENKWDGVFIATYLISVQIADSTYTYKISDYQFFSSTTTTFNDTNELTVGLTTVSSTFTIQRNAYIQLQAPRVQSATLNGVPIEDYYRVTSDMTFVIEPNEGVKVTFAASSISGAGYATYFVDEQNEGGTYVNIRTVGGGESPKQALIIKGRIFRFRYTAGTGTATNGITHNGSSYTLGTAVLADDPAITHHFQVTLKQCLLPTTQVSMADGTTKMVKDIELGDMVLAMNHETGNIEPTPIIINDYDPIGLYNVLQLKFSNGSEIGIVSDHGFFDITTNRYEYINEFNYSNYIGHKFYAITSPTDLSRSEVTLVSAEVREQYTELYSPASYMHFNIITENVLSIAGGIEGLFNIFEYDPLTLQFDQEKMAADIALYGLLPYELFEDLISYEIYVATNAKYFGVAIGKGMLTWDDIMYYAERYAAIMIA